MNAVQVTPIYVALAALLLLGLSARVIAGRIRKRIGLGDGGDADLQRRIRVHANATEYLPIQLLMLLVIELQGLATPWLHGFGGLILLSRLLHAVGLSRTSGTSPGRFAGTLSTQIVIVAMAVAALWMALRG